MKKYRVQGYIPSGQHRWKLVDKVVEIDEAFGITDGTIIGAWLMALELDGRKAGSPYEIKSIEEVTNADIS